VHPNWTCLEPRVLHVCPSDRNIIISFVAKVFLLYIVKSFMIFGDLSPHKFSVKSLILSDASELHKLYASPNIVRVIKSWAGQVARIGEMKNTYKIFVGKSEGRRPLGRHRLRWEDNIKIELREIGWEGVDWFNLNQDRDQWRAVVNTVMNLRVP
jgi:hypothetical protein